MSPKEYITKNFGGAEADRLTRKHYRYMILYAMHYRRNYVEPEENEEVQD